MQPRKVLSVSILALFLGIFSACDNSSSVPTAPSQPPQPVYLNPSVIHMVNVGDSQTVTAVGLTDSDNSLCLGSDSSLGPASSWTSVERTGKDSWKLTYIRSPWDPRVTYLSSKSPLEIELYLRLGAHSCHSYNRSLAKAVIYFYKP